MDGGGKFPVQSACVARVVIGFPLRTRVRHSNLPREALLIGGRVALPCTSPFRCSNVSLIIGPLVGYWSAAGQLLVGCWSATPFGLGAVEYQELLLVVVPQPTGIIYLFAGLSSVQSEKIQRGPSNHPVLATVPEQGPRLGAELGSSLLIREITMPTSGA